MGKQTKAQPKLYKMLEDVLKRKWLLQCIVEPAARNASGENGVYGKLPNLRTCEILQSALALSFTSYETFVLCQRSALGGSRSWRYAWHG